MERNGGGRDVGHSSAPDRRRILAGLVCAATFSSETRSIASPSLVADDGSPMRNFVVADTPGLLATKGLQRLGRPDAAVVVIEAFDYNCGFCRAAGRDLDDLPRSRPEIALALLHTPILSPGSLDVARIQTAIRRRHGAEAAMAAHLAFLGARGFLDGPRARALAADLGMEIGSGDEAAADADVAAQRTAAARAGLKITPTFVMGDTAFVGWPGRATIERFADAQRRCGRIVCG